MLNKKLRIYFRRLYRNPLSFKIAFIIRRISRCTVFGKNYTLQEKKVML